MTVISDTHTNSSVFLFYLVFPKSRLISLLAVIVCFRPTLIFRIGTSIKCFGLGKLFKYLNVSLFFFFLHLQQDPDISVYTKNFKLHQDSSTNNFPQYTLFSYFWYTSSILLNNVTQVSTKRTFFCFSPVCPYRCFRAYLLPADT